MLIDKQIFGACLGRIPCSSKPTAHSTFLIAERMGSLNDFPSIRTSGLLDFNDPWLLRRGLFLSWDSLGRATRNPSDSKVKISKYSSFDFKAVFLSRQRIFQRLGVRLRRATAKLGSREWGLGGSRYFIAGEHPRPACPHSVRPLVLPSPEHRARKVFEKLLDWEC